MSTFPASSQRVQEAAIRGDFDEVERLVADGAALNVCNDSGDSLLEEITLHLYWDGPQPFYLEMLRLLLRLGADPNFFGTGCSALAYAVWNLDIELLEVFLQSGANPNLEGHAESETLYDLAEFDYRYNVWMRSNPEVDSINPPDEPTQADTASEEAWLDFLDRQAIKYGVRRPDYLYLLRRYGAKSTCELEASVRSP